MKTTNTTATAELDTVRAAAISALTELQAAEAALGEVAEVDPAAVSSELCARVEAARAAYAEAMRASKAALMRAWRDDQG